MIITGGRGRFWSEALHCDSPIAYSARLRWPAIGFVVKSGLSDAEEPKRDPWDFKVLKNTLQPKTYRSP